MKNKIFTFILALVASTMLPVKAQSLIRVDDNSIADWDNLPENYVAEAVCPEDAALLGLKSVKVFADPLYINILVEPNMDDITDLEWVPFHVYLDIDNSDATGGYGDEFLDANTDIILETAVFAEGQPFSYNPAVFKWWGEVGGDGWAWTDPSVEHDGSDFWGAIIGEGQLPVGASERVDGKFEIQLLRELLGTVHPLNDTEFGIGFDIMQNWSSVGILPCASATDENPSGKAAKLHVTICPEPIGPEEAEVAVNYLDKDAQVIDKDAVVLLLPEAPAFEGFVFLRWEVVAGNLEDGINIQAVYEADGEHSVPAVVVDPSNPAQKLVREGNVYILKGTNLYTIQGQKVK